MLAARVSVLAHEQPDAGISLRAVPVAPVVLELAQKHRDLIGRRLDLLQAQDVGLFLRPRLHLIEAGADPLTFQVPILRGGGRG